MLIPVIKIRDKQDGSVHIVGSNSHDSLIAYSDHVEYYNLQNGCGTYRGDEYGYEFVYEPNQWGVPYIDFVTLEKFIEISKQDIDENAKNLIEFYKAYKAGVFDEVTKARSEAGIVMDTSGAIIK